MLLSVQRSSVRLNRLIQNYLLFTQLEVIGFDPAHIKQLQTFGDLTLGDPSTIIPKAAAERALFYNRTDDLQVQIEPGTIQILADDLLKIGSELTDNALKFSEVGSPVSIVGKIIGAEYQLSVIDHGRGMRPDQVKSIEVLVQFDRDSFEQQGLGFGLILVRRLAQVYGGTCTITSVPNIGTTVIVMLKVFGRVSIDL